MNFKQLKEYINKCEYTKPIQLGSCTYINNPSQTLKSLLGYLEGQRGNNGYMAYYKLIILIIKEINHE